MTANVSRWTPKYWRFEGTVCKDWATSYTGRRRLAPAQAGSARRCMEDSPMKKNIIAGLLAGLLALSAVACSSGGGGGGGATEGGAASEAPASE